MKSKSIRDGDRESRSWIPGLIVASLVFLGTGSLLADAQGQVEESPRDRGASHRDVTLSKRILTPRIFPTSVPTIDGSIDDLISYVRLLRETGTGCALEISDPDSDVVMTQAFEPCSDLAPVNGGSYFENGYDQELALIAFDGEDFHLGMRVMGQIGDPDGNGSPDNDCGTNIPDSPGIGAVESYKWFIDSNCDGSGDITVIVNNNQVTVTGVAYDNATFDFNGSDLEVLVEGVDIVPQFRARAFAGSDVDGLSEDLSDEMECAPLTPTIEIEKEVGDVCEGQITTVTIRVRNSSPVVLDPVVITDELPAGFSYSGNVTGIGNPVLSVSTLTFPGFALEPDESREITFDLLAPMDCGGLHSNYASVEGTFTHPCNEEPNNERLAFNETTAEFLCRETEVILEDAEICAGFSTEMCVEVLEGTGPYSFSWSGPQDFSSAESCINVDVEGEYTVTVTDAHGCTDTATGHLTVHPNPIVEVNDGVTCAGSTDELCAQIEGGQGPFEFSWTGPDNFTASVQCIDVDVEGDYLVTVTDARGCTGTGSGHLTVYPNPEPRVADAEACSGFEAVLCAEVEGSGPFRFSWEGPGGFNSADSCIASGVAGDYTVTVTDINGCTGTTSGHISIHDNPVVEVNDAETCDGFTAVLCPQVEGGVGPYAFSWDGPADFNSSDSCIAAGVEGDYTVIVTDGHGCTGTGTGHVTIHPTPVVRVEDGEACAGDEIELCAEVESGAGPFAFSWSGPDDFTESDSCITVADEGDYAVTVTDAHGCTSTTTGHATVNPVPVVTVQDVEVCSEDEVQLCAEIEGGSGPFSFSWSGPGDFSSPDSCITVSASGTYSVTVTDSKSCPATASGEVTIFNPGLAVRAQDDEVCPGETGVVLVTIVNTSEGTETFLLECTIDGDEIADIPVGEVDAGDSTVVPIEVVCDAGDTVSVACQVTAMLSGSPDCTAAARVEGRVVCLEPEVTLTKTDDVARGECAIDGSVITYTLEVVNTGQVDLVDIEVGDEVVGSVAYYVDSAVPSADIYPASGSVGNLRWRDPGPLAPGGKLVFSYQVLLSVDGDCEGNPSYGTVAEVDAYCEGARTSDSDGEETCITCPVSCWMTAGGFLNEEQKSGHKEDTFGGNVGPPPRGVWNHKQRIGNKTQFNFQAKDVQAIRCYHDGNDGPCSPETHDNVIEFGGTGEYSLGNGPKKYTGVFIARAEDHGEPGNNPNRSGGCGSPDYYFIEVRDLSGGLVFKAEGFLDGGNIQLHKNTGSLGTDVAMAEEDNGRGTISTGSFEATMEDPNVRLRSFPNPVNKGMASATIQFNVPSRLEGSPVRLQVFDVTGRRVRSVLDEVRPAGLHTASWDLRGDSGGVVPSGVYFYRLQVGNEQKIQRILVMGK